MLAVQGTTIAALVDRDPLFMPGVFLVCGLLASLAASLRGRAVWPKGRRLAVAGYLSLALVGFLAGGIALGYRAQLFWGARWDGSARELVLERIGPLDDIRIPMRNVEAVTEMLASEHGITGPRRSVQFVVHTRSGRTFWSAPLYHRAHADAARETLIAATNRKLERFMIGTEPLPD